MTALFVCPLRASDSLRDMLLFESEFSHTFLSPFLGWKIKRNQGRRMTIPQKNEEIRSALNGLPNALAPAGGLKGPDRGYPSLGRERSRICI